MAAWYWLIGIGFTVIATVLTQMASRRLMEEGHSRGPSSHGLERENSQRPQSRPSTREGHSQNNSVIPDDICKICEKKTYPENATFLSCIHVFHEECLMKYREENETKDCPKCREQRKYK
ncbi:uncharacterized protein LOC142220003 isoform X1 [Haematobia irritans]|uniref:uncharacterized protein LOC142220003 isoform X1 n=1 Tax=Haematobia irritans TaxID=7368 RepID=UPI003F508025